MAKQITLDTLFQVVQLQYNALNRAFDQATTADQMNALLREMREFTHRLDLIQSLRIDAITLNLSAFTADLVASNKALTQSLNSLKKMNEWVKACSTFLGVVDEIIDLVKLA